MAALPGSLLRPLLLRLPLLLLLGQGLLDLPHARRADVDLCALPIRLILRDALIADRRLLSLRVTAGQGHDHRARE